ncbi:MAG: prolyl oligopeptidase family serine peptidase [Planctomycetes bacterium]|nr:prolyl oligopeptidase family serine peptidase [Planctomycetota bacterium]
MRNLPTSARPAARAALVLLPLLTTVGYAQQQPEEIALRDFVVLERVGDYGRTSVHTDAVEHLIVIGRWAAPTAADTVTLPNGEAKAWQTANADADGVLKHAALQGGYAYTSVPSDTPRVMLLDAVGHSRVYVNNELRTGDPYQTGKLSLPVALHAGQNGFLFHCGRGRMQAKLVAPPAPLVLDTRDATLPDLMVGEAIDTWGAVVVINATEEIARGLSLEVVRGDEVMTSTALPPLPPVCARKLGFRLSGRAPQETGEREYELRLRQSTDGQTQTLHTVELKLRICQPSDKHQRTFISDIDGSVQYYAVTPAHPTAEDPAPPALFLTLHGAGVEALGQARAYDHKTWGHIVAATNRRPFGFDWEDWGRLDAMEVLTLAEQRLGTDPRRTYLTGHSMGGHGVWQVGVTYPDRFAAIAPSAGWISFWSYTGAQRFEDATPVEAMLMRATACSDTLSLSRNYLHHGVYILHGEEDDNVPVDQARTMRKHLAEFHADFAYYERPGAGHWWGNRCVDWDPLFEFLRAHERPEPHTIHQIEFWTANPGVSASSHWLTLAAQTHALQPSKADVRIEPEKRRLVGNTENVACLALDLTELSRQRWEEKKGEQIDATVLPAGEPLSIELDGQTLADIPWPAGPPRIWLERDGQEWSLAEEPAAALKGPHRYGPFKQAFRNRMLFVYGTRGTPAENAWAFAKARYDAETFWYRGNGSVDMIPDTAFDPATEPDRNVILYGNADTNAAWRDLLADSPVHIRRGTVVVGERVLAGDDLACLFLRPRPGSARAAVGVISGSGLIGLRVTERLPYFVSGVGYPDWVVLGAEALVEGTAGVRAAGFFGRDWSVESGDSAWRQ